LLNFSLSHYFGKLTGNKHERRRRRRGKVVKVMSHFFIASLMLVLSLLDVCLQLLASSGSFTKQKQSHGDKEITLP